MTLKTCSVLLALLSPHTLLASATIPKGTVSAAFQTKDTQSETDQTNVDRPKANGWLPHLKQIKNYKVRMVHCPYGEEDTNPQACTDNNISYGKWIMSTVPKATDADVAAMKKALALRGSDEEHELYDRLRIVVRLFKQGRFSEDHPTFFLQMWPTEVLIQHIEDLNSGKLTPAKFRANYQAVAKRYIGYHQNLIRK